MTPPADADDKIAVLTQVERQLARITTVDEAKSIRDKAEAVRMYAKSARLGLGVQNRAASIKIRAEQAGGRLTAAMVKSPGGRSTSYTLKEVLGAKTNSGAGIMAHRWETLAQVPTADVLRLEAEYTDGGKELTSAEIVRRVKAQTKADTRQARAQANDAATPQDVVLTVESMADLLGRVRNVDAIITDPPYERDALPLYGELATLAGAALKPGGLLAVLCGQSYLPEILALMAPVLPYRWTLAYLTPGGQAVQLWQRHVNTFWKPVLLFGTVAKGTTPWIGDVVRSDVNDNDKRFHDWGQSESGMGRLVDALTTPGETVCDPFCGGGTTAVVAYRLGRRFVGCDVDPEAITLTRGRFA